MCNAFLGNRGPAHRARRPLRVIHQPFGTEAGGPGSRGAGRAAALAAVADATAVTETGQNRHPFIACAADAVASVEMKAAAAWAA